MCKQMITLLRSVNHQCLVLKNNAGEKVYIDLAPVADKLESQQRELAAANARIAELEQQQFAGQTWVTFDEHMKALKKIKQMEDAIKFDFERFMEFQQRAEQAEAQCAYFIKSLQCFPFVEPKTYESLLQFAELTAKAALEEETK